MSEPDGPQRRAPILLVAVLLSLLAAPLAGCQPADRVAQARELQAAGRFADSIAPLRVRLEEAPDDLEVQYLHGHALAQTGQLSLAQFSLRKAMESPEWLVPAGLELASAAIVTDNPEGAIDVTTRILEAEPENLDALLLRARAQAMSRHRYEPALADAERVIALDPGNVEGATLRVVSLLGLERAEEAEAALAELESTAREAELEPADAARFSAMRAVFAKEKGDPAAAERLFDECLADHPADFLVLKEAIAFFDGQQRPERSVEILRAALVELPTAGVFRRALAERLRQRGEAAEAERTLREGTELENPALAVESWVDLASHHYALGDYAAAADALERAVAIHGRQDPELVFYHADALVMAERYEEALEVARGMSVRPHRELVEGRVALEQGRAAEALERFGEAIRLWPDNAVARYYAALAAEGAGDFDRAIAEYRYSIRADPTATDARLRLARLHDAEGASDLALAAVQHDAGRNPTQLEEGLMAVRVTARLGRLPQLRGLIAEVVRRTGAPGPVMAAAAEGMRERLGPVAAAAWLQSAERLDLEDPRNADALRLVVGCLGEAGQPAEALRLARSALAKHPDAAATHAIHAMALAASGAPADAVRAAYSRALELDPDHPAAALTGLGQLSADAGDATAALDLYARAAAADPEDASAPRAAAALLISLGRREEAETQLEEVLERSPYDAEAAARLAELLLERNADLDRAIALARAGVRFGGGVPAQALLSRALERRGEPALATEAAAAGPPANR